MRVPSNRSFQFILCGILILSTAALAEPLRLPTIFGDHMVLQRDLPVVIWGWAEPDQTVTVSMGSQEKSVTASQQGQWRVQLAPLQASREGQTLRVKTKDGLVEFGDVLVGEVWLCSGQSNMEWRVGQSDDAEQEIANADCSLIRHIEIDHVMLPEPRDDVASKKGWEVCTPKTVPSFTATGYFFGRELFDQLDVPIGLVNSCWGGSNIEAFTSLEGFRQVPSLSEYVSRIETSQPDNPAYKKAVTETMAAAHNWLAQAEQALEGGQRVTLPPALPKGVLPLMAWADPANKHNAMIQGLVPYRIRGSIWYQGESNHAEGMRYVDKTRALVRGWRQAWGQPDLPYYYVQIAPYVYGEEDPEILPIFWEAQEAIETEIPHTGMVVIHDVGNLRDIHPRNKKPVGRRLALQALNKTYGKDVVSGGPQFDRLMKEGPSLRVWFKRTGSGLVTSDGEAPDWFEIAGENGLFLPAQARIDGKSVVLSHDRMKTPCAMRYAWSKMAEPNLRNREGFSVSPFRAGEIPERALVDGLVKQAKAYSLIYSTDVGAAGTTQKAAAYRVNHAKEIGAFDRVAYFLALKKADAPVQYVWASMDPFVTQATKLGVPTSAVDVTFRMWVRQMTVQSNVPGVVNGEGIKGYIEFWPNNYNATNGHSIENASDEAFDFGDTPVAPRQGYGSMQIHNPAARQTVLAVNKWHEGASADVGIGNSPTGNPDYTFRSNAGEYQLKRLMVLVRTQ
ncbi:MAG: sialate O-acetylesterase [Planctomycetes bacterium]|nr:sialate O-acetylesterase [Planctomycetota bacterium]